MGAYETVALVARVAQREHPIAVPHAVLGARTPTILAATLNQLLPSEDLPRCLVFAAIKLDG